MKNQNKINNKDYLWYAITIGNQNAQKIIEDIENLKTSRILKIVDLSSEFEKIKIKNKILFLHISLSDKLKKALLEIPGVKFFIPNNRNPYNFFDVNVFLRHHFNQNQITNIKSRYQAFQERSNLLKNEAIKNAYAEKHGYKIGDMVIINNGVFKEKSGIIKEINGELIVVNVQIDNTNRVNISTTLNIYDAELFKNNNE
ncbi:transcription antiterminator [uncultured bacterium]|nr:transcription antiterminator [uncultured bacterium]